MERWSLPIPGPHHGQPVLMRGEAFHNTRGVIIAMHGRDMLAEEILKMVEKLQASSFTLLAPQACGRSWCPERFNVPLEQNEPWLSSSLRAIDWLVEQSLSAGIQVENIVLFGFSQGACLVLESAARYPRHYGGVASLAGALFGPTETRRPVSKDLDGTRILMGCSDEDPYIPMPNLQASADALRGMGATIDFRIYPGIGHRVNLDEIHAVNKLLADINLHKQVITQPDTGIS